MYLECNPNVTSVSRIWPEYFPIGYKNAESSIFISLNTTAIEYRPPGWCCFAPDCCPPARPAWKRCGGNQEKKEEEKTQKISDPSMSGRGEEDAVWTLRQTDGGAQSKRPTVLLQLPQDGACHVWWICAESGAKDREAGYQHEEGATYKLHSEACHFASPLNDTRMFRMLLECCKTT